MKGNWNQNHFLQLVTILNHLCSIWTGLRLQTHSLPGNFIWWLGLLLVEWLSSPLFSTGKPSTKQESMGHFQKPQWIPTLHHNQCLRYRGKGCFGTEASRVGEVSEFASGCARGWLSNWSLTRSKWTEMETKFIALTLKTWEAWHFYLDNVTILCQDLHMPNVSGVCIW